MHKFFALFLVLAFCLGFAAEITDEELILAYANYANITVDENELMDYFVHQVGSHPKFSTEGYFDYEKFNNQKENPEVQSLLAMMERDIIISKVKTALTSNISINNDELLEAYVKENLRVDISYSLIKQKLAAAPLSASALEAKAYFEQNKDAFIFPVLAKFEFNVLPLKTFADSINVDSFEVIKLYNENYNEEGYKLVTKTINDSSYTYADTLQYASLDDVTNQLYKQIYDVKLKKYTLQKAEEIKKTWKMGIQPKKTLVTPFVSKKQKLGNWLNSDVLEYSFALANNEISNPVYADSAFVVVKKLFEKKADESYIKPEDIWLKYLSYKNTKEVTNQYFDYYMANIDSFIVKAAVVTKIEIDNNTIAKNSKGQSLLGVIEEIKQNIFDNPRLLDIVDDYSLQHSNPILFLSKLSNNSYFDEEIAEKINKGKTKGIIFTNGTTVIWKIDSSFDQYLPDFDQIENQLEKFYAPELVKNNQTDFMELYKQHYQSLCRQDSIKIGGMFFNADSAKAEVSYSEIQNYYNNNLSMFYRDNAIELDCFKIDDPYKQFENFAWNFSLQTPKFSFEYLKKSFGTDEDFCGIIEIKNLNSEIVNAVSELGKNEVSDPVYINNAYYFFIKKQNIKAGLISIGTAENSIRKKLQQHKNRQYAYNYVKAVFDTTSTWWQYKKNADYDYYFESELQGIDINFAKLGNLKKYEKELFRTSGKFNRVLSLPNGSAMLFILKKKTFTTLEDEAERKEGKLYKQLSFDEALPILIDKHKKNKQEEKAEAFLAKIAEDISKGTDVSDIFSFIGKWKHAKNLNLDSKIENLSYSKAIIENAIKSKVSKVAKPIKISKDTWLLYKVDNKKSVNKKSFYKQKAEFKNQLIERKMYEYLNEWKKVYMN